jgi:hypothetical protein
MTRESVDGRSSLKGRDALIDAARVTAIDEFVKVKGIFM